MDITQLTYSIWTPFFSTYVSKRLFCMYPNTLFALVFSPSWRDNNLIYTISIDISAI